MISRKVRSCRLRRRHAKIPALITAIGPGRVKLAAQRPLRVKVMFTVAPQVY